MVKERNEAGADAAALECNRICETEYLGLPAGAEKRGEDRGALLPENPGDHHRPVVEPLVGGDPEEAVDGSRLGVGRPEDDFGNPGVDGGPGAHHARLERHHEAAAREPVVGKLLRRPAQGEDLRVRGGVVPRNHPVVRSGDDLPGGPHHHRADRYLSLVRCLLRLGKRGPHPLLPVSHARNRGDRPSVPERAGRTGNGSPPFARRGKISGRTATPSAVRPAGPREGPATRAAGSASRGAVRGGDPATAGQTSRWSASPPPWRPRTS